MSAAKLRERLSLAMDGVVLTMPPSPATDRWNFCKYGETQIWRKPSESASPELAGNDDYGNQAPLSRAVPLWGGVSTGGFSAVVFHQSKKMKAAEWCAAVDAGKLRSAITALEPTRPAGPWCVLCDNESFLRASTTTPLYRREKVRLWKIPARSPDCNPVEKFWAWLRRRLHAMDLKDAVEKRPVLTKAAYRRRVQGVCGSRQAQRVASSCALGLKRVCKELLKKKGAATRG
jgi:hypothetical protein